MKNIGIDFVVNEDINPKKVWNASRGYDITCPFCGGERKLNINPNKGVFRCAKCDEKGNAVQLHAKLLNISTKEAYKDLTKRFEGLPVEKREVFIKKEPESYVTPLGIDIRDKVNRNLLLKLALSDKHHDDLLKRGLSEADIVRGGYKTLPIVGLQEIATFACDTLDVPTFYEKWGVPGFYDIGLENPKMVRRRNGFLCPCKTVDGKISGFQIRHDNLPETATKEEKERFAKYTWLTSSEKKTGCSMTGCENIHHAGDWSKVPEVINLTEGLLKADIASALSGKNFLGLSGVNNTSQLKDTLSILKNRGAKRVNLCLDMDYREKQEVRKAMEKIKSIISEVGLEQQLITWPEKYKGVDDFLLARRLGQN